MRSIFDKYDSTKKGIEIWLQTNKKKKTHDNYNNMHIGMRNHKDAACIINT